MNGVILAASTFAVVALDQGSKHLALRRQPDRVLLNRRTGVLAAMRPGTALALWLPLTVLAFTVVAAGIVPRSAELALGLTVGGAAGNLLDRFTRRAIVDFIDVGRWWPRFNLADVSLVCGVVLCAWTALSS